MGQSMTDTDLRDELPAEAPTPIVLELRQVSFRGRSENGIRLHRANLRIHEGELVAVQLESATRTREAASMIQGLVPPLDGDVMFCNEDWLGSDYDRHFRMRSRIGRVFQGQAWIENLNVNENVTLSCRHHGCRDDLIGEDVQFWVSLLGMEGLSRKRPAFVEPSVLQIHQWIRAFLRSPVLVILERPMQHLSSTWLGKLIEAVDVLRARGTAVLWFANEDELATAAAALPLVRLRLQDEKLRRLDGGASDE